ncbi:DUF802 domain-containing protein [Parahaliea aestuarii]|uniref:DUF802 domain-containing protein n=1 Tax=Parahaliea aestuarii TaxID=1852021 RepID=A0A5C8ZTI0_9GAMM|nr:DUF802 domain-containing protein [Parahaliea aestuarii]TXS91099.1 DUF802 domain-containing protein [Parahaliea aestuarii]
MNRLLFPLVGLAGAAVIAWVAAGFVGATTLALAVTLLIGAAYGVGVAELWRFRRSTGSLVAALAMPAAEVGTLTGWLARLDSELRGPVQLRIEGQSVALPGPLITPYLVGLLVMLGLLGTFFGMVDTLSGAVGALQGSTELDAIRAGLAAPIAGLGVAFGTSVAGIAASACLGLLSVICRRERLLAGRALDSFARDIFPDHHLDRRRQQAFEALEAQSAAVPAVVDRLDALVDRLSRLGGELGDSLLANQKTLQDGLGESFSRLAQQVGDTMHSSLSESGRAAAEGIRPALESTVSALAEHSSSTQAQLIELAREQGERLAGHLHAATAQLQAEVNAAAEKQLQAHATLTQQIGNSLASSAAGQQAAQAEQQAGLLAKFEALFVQTEALVAQRADAEERWLAQHQERMSALLAQSAAALDELASADETRAAASQQRLLALESALQEHQQASAAAETERLQQLDQRLQALLEQSSSALAAIRDSEAEGATRVLTQLQALQAEQERQGAQTLEAQQQSLVQQGELWQSLAANLAEQLGALRDAEEQRAEASAQRLAALEAVAAEHLGALGASLEAPMTRLIETASETPKAAAEVIAQLRKELSNNVVRDNQLLEEREQLLERLAVLLDNMESTSAGQLDAVQSAVSRSADTLLELGQTIGADLNGSAGQLAGLAVDVAGSAGDVASLGESFRVAVEQFGEANQALIDGLERMEQAMERSGARSDEQLGYYVAQAREIIDHSVLSQKEIIEELRQLGGQQQLFAPEANS